MKWLYILLALAAGAILPIQAGINLRLRQALGAPELATLVSFTVGTIVLAAYVLGARISLPTGTMLLSAPWWAWLGGAFGAFFVFSSIVLAANLGAATTMAWLLAGQFIAALLLDHYGAISYDVHPLSLPRVIGVVMLIVGAVLVNRY